VLPSDVEQLLRTLRAPGFAYRQRAAAARSRLPGGEAARRPARREHTIAFVSPVAGAGRTALAASVAYALARRGWRSVAVDLDRKDELRRHFERAAAAPVQRLQPSAGSLGAEPDTGGPAWVPFGDASSYLDALAAEPDAVIVDAPAGLTSALDEPLALADEVVVVIRPDAASRGAVRATDAFLARTRMRATHRFVARYVVNLYDGRRETHRAEWASLRRTLGARIWPSPVQWDAALASAREAGRDVHALAPASQVVADVDALAGELMRSEGETRHAPRAR
jgi:cellulose biosynthesis protein BcsQ